LRVDVSLADGSNEMPCNIQAKEESQALLEPLSDVTLAKRKFWVAFFG